MYSAKTASHKIFPQDSFSHNGFIHNEIQLYVASFVYGLSRQDFYKVSIPSVRFWLKQDTKRFHEMTFYLLGFVRGEI